MLKYLFKKLFFPNNFQVGFSWPEIKLNKLNYNYSWYFIIKNYFTLSVAFFYFSFTAISQTTYHDFGFQKSFDIIVKGSNGNILGRAWEGGINSAQLCSIDLNLDGKKDLVIFDRTGNRIMPYINSGLSGTQSFTYAPEYELKFPDLHDWLILADYDNDGKSDIFTYSYGGIAVYHNISDISAGLKFELKTPLLLSYQYNGYVNLFLTSVDYPAIDDLDGDGDLDILSFFGLGTYLEYHKNQSVEKYGNTDSLDFKRVEQCWGYFAENSSNNNITLNITCPWKNLIKESEIFKNKGAKHTGSTMLSTDLNGDNVKDLLIGDIDYRSISALYNGGNQDSAHIISVDTNFPAYDTPLDLVSLPVSSSLDVDNDGINDLVFSPFEPNPLIPESYRSMWFYKNTGTNSLPVYQLQTNGLFQEEMIETGTGAYPVLYDINGDNLTDLFIANYGYRDSSYINSNGFLQSVFTSKISYYKNTGTITNPIFQLQTNDFANISSLKLLSVYPSFEDLDNDGDIDMITGDANGGFMFFRNSGGQGNEPVMTFETLTTISTLNVGKYSTPQLVDLDDDGLTDLISGEKNGNLNYFKNTGTAQNPVFSYITDSLGKVNVTDYNLSYTGYSTPCFFKDISGKWKLFCGTEQGIYIYYDNIENNITGTFQVKEPQLGYIKDGTRTGISAADINNDGFLDLITGNMCGGVCYYKGITPPPSGILNNDNISNNEIILYPNPAKEFIILHLPRQINPYNYNIKIFNIMGAKIKEICADKKYEELTISTSGLAPGIYICRIATTENSGIPINIKNLKFILSK